MLKCNQPWSTGKSTLGDTAVDNFELQLVWCADPICMLVPHATPRLKQQNLMAAFKSSIKIAPVAFARHLSGKVRGPYLMLEPVAADSETTNTMALKNGTERRKRRPASTLQCLTLPSEPTRNQLQSAAPMPSKCSTTKS